MDKLKIESGKWKVFTVIAVRVMLNLFQHLTGLVYLLQASKILKQVQDDNVGVNIFHYYSSMKGGYKTFATNLGVFNSSLKDGYKTLARNLGVFNSNMKGECKTFATNLGMFNSSVKERYKKCLA
ncbi:hypothetical protein IJ384_01640 [bacterium]|nr:hypothetical protein [bacterium]